MVIHTKLFVRHLFKAIQNVTAPVERVFWNAKDFRDVDFAVVQSRKILGNNMVFHLAKSSARTVDVAIAGNPLTPPTIEIVGFLGGAARFIAKP